MPAPRTSPTRRAANFDSLEQEAFLNVWRTYDRLRALEDELFGDFGLTPQQYNILRLLQTRHPDGYQTLQLAARLVSRAPDITRMLDKLVEHGWVDRHRHAANRRVVEVRLTESGLELLQQISDQLHECHARQLGHLSAADLKQLCSLLRAARAPHEAEDSPWK
ncbi:MAG: MarR family transcriptional regulator [Pirellulales bacterium]|nr:MarR family transcriptional regulator [Pirellulales bacterium]